MKKLFILLVLTVLLLTACTAPTVTPAATAQPDAEPTQEPAAVPESPAASEEPDAFTRDVPMHIHEGLLVTLRMHGRHLGTGDGYVRIEVLGEDGALVQNLSIADAIRSQWGDGAPGDSTEFAAGQDGYAMMDVNFDGMCDLALDGWMTAGANLPRYYWVWDDAAQQFVYSFCLSNVEVDKVNQLLITEERESAAVTVTTVYQWQNGALCPISRTENEGS